MRLILSAIFTVILTYTGSAFALGLDPLEPSCSSHAYLPDGCEWCYVHFHVGDPDEPGSRLHGYIQCGEATTDGCYEQDGFIYCYLHRAS